MKTSIAIVALLLAAAVLFGCTNVQQNPPQQPPPQQPPGGQPQVAMPIEDIAAQELESELPSGYENFTNLEDLLVDATG